MNTPESKSTEREEKSSDEKYHSVHTPTPPQVMDPSEHPVPQKREDKNKKKGKDKVNKNEDMDDKKLTPREEL